MAKTRSQTGNRAIKKEEQEDCKDNLLWHSVSNTTKRRNKISKQKPSKNKNRNLPDQQVKVEEDADTKLLFKTSYKCTGPPTISQEQINGLIDYVVNHKKSVLEASRKVNVSMTSGYKYYNLYKNDPDRKTPLLENQHIQHKQVFMQEDIDNLIKYIVVDKMSVKEASAKANMSCKSGGYYYNKYLKDPKHNIPVRRFYQHYTQHEKNEFIRHIVNDKMSIPAASRLAKMSTKTGNYYYRKYFKVQNPDIPVPSHVTTRKCYTQERIKEVIHYIVKGKMSIRGASRKANMCPEATRRHYRLYLKDNNMEIPVPKYIGRCPQNISNLLVRYIVDDNMTIKAASKEVNVHYETGRKYYRQYLKDHKLDLPTRRIITQDQHNKLIGYIVNDKMTIKAASIKANMSYSTGMKYYGRYLNTQKRGTRTCRL